MSLPARLTGLQFDGVSLQRLSPSFTMHFDIEQGLNDGLEVRGEDSTVPGADGQVPRNRKRHVRHLVLKGLVMGRGATEALRQANFQNLMDELEETFALDADPATLEGTARDGSTRSIEARTTNIVLPDEEPAMSVGYVSVMLDSVVPDWEVTGGSS